MKRVPAGLSAEDLVSDAIYIRVTGAEIGPTSGLAADSTGVKTQSGRFTFSLKHVKQLVLRSSISSIPTDATVRVGIYNVTKGSYVVSRDYAGATGEHEDTTTTLPDDGDVLELRVEVTTASATSGATFDLGYATLMIDYGIS